MPRTFLEHGIGGAIVLRIDGSVFVLAPDEFADLARDVMDKMQARIMDTRARVRPGAVPHRALFKLRFQLLHTSGQYPLRGHHLIPDGDYSEDALWTLLLNSIAAGSYGNADSAELATLILESLGFSAAQG